MICHWYFSPPLFAAALLYAMNNEGQVTFIDCQYLLALRFVIHFVALAFLRRCHGQFLPCDFLRCLHRKLRWETKVFHLTFQFVRSSLEERCVCVRRFSSSPNSLEWAFQYNEIQMEIDNAFLADVDNPQRTRGEMVEVNECVRRRKKPRIWTRRTCGPNEVDHSYTDTEK